jgi:hypothetical protein
MGADTTPPEAPGKPTKEEVLEAIDACLGRPPVMISVPYDVLADVAGILGCAVVIATKLEESDESVDLRRALQCAHRMVSEALLDE